MNTKNICDSLSALLKLQSETFNSLSLGTNREEIARQVDHQMNIVMDLIQDIQENKGEDNEKQLDRKREIAIGLKEDLQELIEEQANIICKLKEEMETVQEIAEEIKDFGTIYEEEE